MYCQIGSSLSTDSNYSMRRQEGFPKKEEWIILVAVIAAIVIIAPIAYKKILLTTALNDYQEALDSYAENRYPQYEDTLPIEYELDKYDSAYSRYLDHMDLEIYTEGENTRMTLKLAGVRYDDGRLDTRTPAADPEYEGTWEIHSYDGRLEIDLSNPNGYRIHLYDMVSVNGRQIMNGYVKDDHDEDWICGLFLLQ